MLFNDISDFGLYFEMHTSVVQLELPAGHSLDKQTGQYIQAESHKTEKQLEQQRQECCHNHWHHNPGLTGSSHEQQPGQQDNQLRNDREINVFI